MRRAARPGMTPVLRAPLLTAFALWFSACATARGPAPLPADHTLLPGTKISVALPPDFRLQANGEGLESADGRSAIFGNELAGSVYATMRSFSSDGFRKGGMDLHTQERLTIDDWPARLYRVTQPVVGAELIRFVLVFGDSGTSVVLNAVAPGPDEAAALRETLLSARWHRAGVLEAGP